jgi:hypothetical protein
VIKRAEELWIKWRGKLKEEAYPLARAAAEELSGTAILVGSYAKGISAPTATWIR